MPSTAIGSREPRRAHYLRPDLPDGHADALLAIVRKLLDGAVYLRTGSQSPHQADRYNAAIDGNRLMRETAEQLAKLARCEKLPG